MTEPKINPKFQTALDSLADDEYALLEENIVKHGLEAGIVTWRGFIIDGHNRWNIVQKHNLEWFTINRDNDFADEDEVLEWIDFNQFGRRNLNDNQRADIIGRIYNRRKKKQGAQIGNQSALKSEVGILSTSFLRDLEAVKSDAIGSAVEVVATQNESAADVADLAAAQSEAVAEDIAKIKQAEANEDARELPESAKPRRDKTAEDVAEKFGINEKTVRRYGKIEGFLKTQPDSERKAFLNKQTTQTQILKKAEQSKPTTPAPPKPAPETAETDAFTQAVANRARRLHDLLNQLKEIVGGIGGECFTRQIRLRDLAPEVGELNFNNLINDAQMLKSLRKCAACRNREGDKQQCKWCSQVGYQNKSDYSTTKSALENAPKR